MFRRRTKEERVKIVVAIGLIAPSAARLTGSELAIEFANLLTVVTGLVWLLEL